MSHRPSPSCTQFIQTGVESSQRKHNDRWFCCCSIVSSIFQRFQGEEHKMDTWRDHEYHGTLSYQVRVATGFVRCHVGNIHQRYCNAETGLETNDVPNAMTYTFQSRYQLYLPSQENLPHPDSPSLAVYIVSSWVDIDGNNTPENNQQINSTLLYSDLQGIDILPTIIKDLDTEHTVFCFCLVFLLVFNQEGSNVMITLLFVIL